ncbi:hypothetical protein SAMN04488564_118159 [Lentzea waywayandensis]|uniref:Uncharacterized protein n=2 Tax=Lentzea waywayandensis TaxID=84724 RepID=A0A1I6FHJ1_9PSEU|nr:hypothetical protein [Lentzea waywayandensis]SFR29358.1 hypothetical protein SAMN04488564_118159 [Lentzea waywayandensis]
MRNQKLDMSETRLMLTELPELKTREVDGHTEVVTDQDGANQYVVSLFKKQPGAKGEEIRVTLSADPGDGFEDGDSIELIDPRASFYSFRNGRGENVAGIAYRALGLRKLA